MVAVPSLKDLIGISEAFRFLAIKSRLDGSTSLFGTLFPVQLEIRINLAGKLSCNGAVVMRITTVGATLVHQL